MNTNFLYGGGGWCLKKKKEKRKSFTLFTPHVLDGCRFFNKLALSFCGQQKQPGGLIDVQVPAERGENKSAGVIFHIARAHDWRGSPNGITRTVTNSIKSLISNKLA